MLVNDDFFKNFRYFLFKTEIASQTHNLVKKKMVGKQVQKPLKIYCQFVLYSLYFCLLNNSMVNMRMVVFSRQFTRR